MTMNPTMLTRQLTIKNINPQKLGYILKDGTINFQSESSAFNFARNMVDKALKSKEPFERFVLWKGPRVHLIVDGTAKEIKPITVAIPTGASSMHGHIVDMPLGIQDYITHIAGYMDKSYAFCPSGKYSKITTLPGEDINNISTQKKMIKMQMKDKIINKIVNFKQRMIYYNSLLIGGCELIKHPKKYNSIDDFCESIKRKLIKKIASKDKNYHLDMWKMNSGKKSGVIFETTLNKTAISDDDVERYSRFLL